MIVLDTGDGSAIKLSCGRFLARLDKDTSGTVDREEFVKFFSEVHWARVRVVVELEVGVRSEVLVAIRSLRGMCFSLAL